MTKRLMPTMRVIFSRKGFDSAAGKAPSPIIEGEPISLPIPTQRRSETSYRLAGLGHIVEDMTKGRIGAGDLCHEDPMFLNGRWAFGQTGAAQSHLERNGVGVGVVFLFFGLFASRDGRDRHHRIFGYLEVDEVRRLGSRPSKSDNPKGFLRRHPHTIGEWNENNTLYLGSGAKARSAHRGLPAEMQGDLARVLLQLAGVDQPLLHLSAEEEASFDESLAQADRAQFATDEEVRAIWAKHGM